MAKSDLYQYFKTDEELDEIYGPDIYAKTSNIPPYKQLKTAMINDGFAEELLPDQFETDGRIHKFGDPNKRGDNAYWYQIHDNGVYWYGHYGSFRPIASTKSGEDRFSKIFRSKPAFEVDRDENGELEKHMNEMEAAARSKEFEDQKKRIENMLIGYDNMDDDGVKSHKYIISKKIKATSGVKIDGLRRLVIPLYDDNNRVSNVQYIAPDGFKKFETGISSTGLFHYIPGNKDVTFICEGYATGVSISMATCQHVICSMTAANLINISDFIIKNKFKNPIVVADNDDPDNVFPDGKGQHYAKLLASKIDGKCIIIDSVDDKKGSDANDYMIKYSAEALKDFISKQIDAGKSKKATGLDVISSYALTDESIAEMEESVWLYKDLVKSRHVLFIAAQHGAGKTTIMFNEVCMQIIKDTGYEIYYIDEDSNEDDYKRMAGIIEKNGLKGKMRQIVPTLFGKSTNEILDNIQKCINEKTDCSSKVFVFDTFRKFSTVFGKGNKKNEANGFTILLASFAKVCHATCIVLGHCNKHRDADGRLVIEGGADIGANVSELIYFDSKKHKNGDVYIKTIIDKQRGFFGELNFKINIADKTRSVEVLDSMPEIGADIKDDSKNVSMDDIMTAAKEIISESKTMVNQTVLENGIMELLGSGRNKIKGVLNSNVPEYKDGMQLVKGDMYYKTGHNNAKTYYIVKG